MSEPTVANWLRVHRRKAGLTQREIARLLGYDDPYQVSRHERMKTAPPLIIALAYEVLFGESVSTLFSAFRLTAASAVERSIEEFERHLQEEGKGRAAGRTAQKLQWLTDRKCPKVVDR